MSPKVAPTWSAIPACAGVARVVMRSKVSAVVTHPLTLPSPPPGERDSRARPPPVERVSRIPLPSRERAGVRVLENNGRLVDTEDGPQGVADLAERHPRLHGGQDERHQVVPSARGPIDGLEGLRGRRRVAAGSQAPDALGQ